MEISYEGVKRSDRPRYTTSTKMRAMQLPQEKLAASMPVLLLVEFPGKMHCDAKTRGYAGNFWYTANSEDIVGIDSYGKFAASGEPVVATYHGAMGKYWNTGFLTLEKIIAAREMHKNNGQKGINEVQAAILDDIYTDGNGKPIDVLTQLLNEGVMPDGTYVPVFSYAQMLAGKTPKPFEFDKHYVVVRPLALAMQTASGYESIGRLTERDGKISQKNGSQVIAYAGGIGEAQIVIDTARERFISGKLGVWHPFNDAKFNPKQSHARKLFMGAGPFGDYDGLNGADDVFNRHSNRPWIPRK